MSLKDTLEKLADDLDNCTDIDDLNKLWQKITGFAGKLRGIASVLPEESAPHPLFGMGTHKEMGSREFSHQYQMALAQEEARSARRKASAQESHDGRFIFCEDGPYGGVATPVDASMPENAFTSVAGHVYQLRDGRLHYTPPKPAQSSQGVEFEQKNAQD